MEGPLLKLLISFRSVNKHDRHWQFLFLVGQFLSGEATTLIWPLTPKATPLYQDKFHMLRDSKNTILSPLREITSLIWQRFHSRMGGFTRGGLLYVDIPIYSFIFSRKTTEG
jgi:hypothetical protein